MDLLDNWKPVLGLKDGGFWLSLEVTLRCRTCSSPTHFTTQGCPISRVLPPANADSEWYGRLAWRAAGGMKDPRYCEVDCGAFSMLSADSKGLLLRTAPQKITREWLAQEMKNLEPVAA